MSDLITFAAWQSALERQGYALSETSPQGSALFTAKGKQSYRVSPWEPNAATAAYLKRNGVSDARCAVSDEWPTPPPSDLPEFGLYVGGDGDYHSDTTHITNSMAGLFLASRERYRATYITGELERKKPTSPMKIGTICHAICLEGKTLGECAVEYPYSAYTDGATPRLSTKRAAEFEQKVSPLICVRREDMPRIERIVQSVTESPYGDLLRVHSARSKCEFRVDAELFGLKVKCKPDWFALLDDQIIVGDLKFGSYEPADWERSQRRFQYWRQQAWYTLILEDHFKLPVSWSFWTFETEGLFRGGPKEYDTRSIELAREKTKQLMKDIKRCYDTGDFSDNFNTTSTVAPWDIGDDVEESANYDIGSSE